MKNLVFIRHAESTYNVHVREHGRDAGHASFLRDAGLTAKGVEQAKVARAALTDTLDALGEDLPFVVSSPLTRSLHTALLARPERAPFIEVWPELREIVSGCDDIGTPASILRESPVARAASGKSDTLAALDEIWCARTLRHRPPSHALKCSTVELFLMETDPPPVQVDRARETGQAKEGCRL